MGKKPADTVFLKAPYEPIAIDMNNVKDRDMKAPINHMKGLCDALTMFFWFSATSPAECIDFLKEYHGQVFFWTNKILKTGSDSDHAWTNAFTDLLGAFKDFVSTRAETIL